MFVFVGLGNPGIEYDGTRHNVGFGIIDQLAELHAFGKWRMDFKSLYLRGSLHKEDIIFIKPQTYMNQSGESLKQVISFFKIDIQQVIVFHDDMDIKLGRINIKRGGGSAGHNGIVSLSTFCGNDYKRIRVGIGHPENSHSVSEHVLGHFNSSELEVLNKTLSILIQSIGHALCNEDVLLEKIVNTGL